VAAAGKSGVNVGDQVKALADGMGVLKQAGVTNADVKMVADMISMLGNAMAELEYNASGANAVTQIANALVALGSIPQDVIDTINQLTRVDYRAVAQMFAVFNDIGTFDNIDNLDDLIDFAKNFTDSNPEALIGFVKLFNDIDEGTVRSMMMSMNALKQLSVLSDELDIDQAKHIAEIGKYLDISTGTYLSDFINSFKDMSP